MVRCYCRAPRKKKERVLGERYLGRYHRGIETQRCQDVITAVKMKFLLTKNNKHFVVAGSSSSI